VVSVDHHGVGAVTNGSPVEFDVPISAEAIDELRKLLDPSSPLVAHLAGALGEQRGRDLDHRNRSGRYR